VGTFRRIPPVVQHMISRGTSNAVGVIVAGTWSQLDLLRCNFDISAETTVLEPSGFSKVMFGFVAVGAGLDFSSFNL
jgi:hypothetical protein